MNVYSCCKCNMSVKIPTCAKCGCELKHSQIKVDNKDVQVCSCPSGCGKIKSPQCCGSDMEVSKCCDMKDKK